MRFLLLSACLFFTMLTYSQQLVYSPVNPAFGGDTFNYQWLLNSANSQNSFEDPNALGFEQPTEFERLTQDINRQILSGITRNLYSQQLGSNLSEGTITAGSLALEIFETRQGLVINILDVNTGEQTQIVVPNP